MILTVDMGTSVTKVAGWESAGLAALSETALTTVHPAPGRVEQDPATWWPSVVASCAEVRAAVGDRWSSVEVIGCTGARQTLALFDAVGRPLGPGILWSDRRAVAEAADLARPLPPASGIVVDGGSVAAKLAWLAVHDAPGWKASRWVLTPRDRVVWQLTGEVVTDLTMASRSGLYDLDDRLGDEWAGPADGRLAPVVAPGQVVGGLSAQAAESMGLRAGTPVVMGPADRPSEVVGAGATERWPMVSWGTTANVSVPVAVLPASRPPGIVLSRGAREGWLLEGGLSAAGSLVAWLGRLTGLSPDELTAQAGSCPPGARGVTVTPWLDGARAPWWRLDARVALVGLDSAHGTAEVARAAIEGVGWEVRRCLDAMRPGPRATPVGLVLGGGGAAVPVWSEVLTGITGLPARRRRSGQAASAGAAVVAGRAVGLGVELDDLDPVIEQVEPDPVAVDHYAGLRGRSDRVADLAMAVADPAEGSGEPGDGRSGGTGCA